MNKYPVEYQPPKTQIFRFDNNDSILTESGDIETPSYYAANVLNVFMGGNNTTIEK